MDMVTLLVSFITSLVVAYATAKYQSEIAAQSKFDVYIRDMRYEVYKVLWKKSGLFPRWPRATKVTYEQLETLSEDMRFWYYETGGIYLSEVSRKIYGYAQEKITSVLSNNLDRSQIIASNSDDYQQIMEKLSAMRTQLTRDLSSRRNAPSYMSDDLLS